MVIKFPQASLESVTLRSCENGMLYKPTHPLATISDYSAPCIFLIAWLVRIRLIW